MHVASYITFMTSLTVFSLVEKEQSPRPLACDTYSDFVGYHMDNRIWEVLYFVCCILPDVQNQYSIKCMLNVR